MTIRQKLLQWIYPFIMHLTGSKSKILLNTQAKQPLLPIYDITMNSIAGIPVDFAQFKGKKLLLVNTASDCGYTAQYGELQKLQERYGDKLIVIGFPSNDFKEQEKADNAEIEKFCKINYGVQFQLMEKSVVMNHPSQNPIFNWLSNETVNGWNSQAPAWNFCKYLVDENGMLKAYFSSGVSPYSKLMLRVMNE